MHHTPTKSIVVLGTKLRYNFGNKLFSSRLCLANMQKEMILVKLSVPLFEPAYY